MDFDFTEIQTDLKKSILQFAKKELNSLIPVENRDKNFPRQAWQKCAEMGLMSLPLEQKYGGLETDLLTSTYIPQ